MKIEGTTILVTGASSGIGAALAPQLAERGATVGIVARRAERLEEVLERCRKHAPESRMWAADLGDLERAEAVAREAWDVFGHLDCLVNNAAIAKRKHTLDLTSTTCSTRWTSTSSPPSAWQWPSCPACKSAAPGSS
jgi:NAD(P)-dependent dehydrogenase (short-subunit alcohol dehydrogenase family)